jgi:5-formyltetrahydrofolate cyclo-ligase
MNSTDHQLDKAQLRRQLLKMRRSLPQEEWQEKSDRICSHLHSSSVFSLAKTILLYFSFRQEPNLSLLFTNSSRRWGFPRCVGNTLTWHLWTEGDALETGTYGILEPSSTAPRLEPAEVDLILVPAVACDKRGYRLGYGGGFYDRMLSSAEWASKPTIGIVFEFAYLSQLPIDGWDKPLQTICTETGLHPVQSPIAISEQI